MASQAQHILASSFENFKTVTLTVFVNPLQDVLLKHDALLIQLLVIWLIAMGFCKIYKSMLEDMLKTRQAEMEMEIKRKFEIEAVEREEKHKAAVEQIKMYARDEFNKARREYFDLINRGQVQMTREFIAMREKETLEQELRESAHQLRDMMGGS